MTESSFGMASGNCCYEVDRLRLCLVDDIANYVSCERFWETATKAEEYVSAMNGDGDGGNGILSLDDGGDGILSLADDVDAMLSFKDSVVNHERNAAKKKSSEYSIQWEKMRWCAKFGFVNYSVPPELARVFENKLRPFDGMTDNESAALNAISNFKKTSLNATNYRNFLAVNVYALFHEKLKEVAAWRILDTEIRLHFGGGDGCHLINVPGVVDKSPDVRKGDSVEVTIRGIRYTMAVIKIKGEDVYLQMDDKAMEVVFPYGQSVEKCSVDFVLNDYVFELHHTILKTLTGAIVASLFPRSGLKERQQQKPKHDGSGEELTLFNESIRSNPQQYQAVKNILKGTSGNYPYVLFGPPGTGKTITLVESIKQVWKSQRHSKILVATPSNSAADLLALKLLDDVPPVEIVRLNSRWREDVPSNPRLKSICLETHATMKLPKNARIICATLITTGHPKFRPFGQQTHIFVDEAGQAMEPEILVPLTRHLCGREGRWVLAGDPHQLGPVVPEGIAKTLGLNRSLLQRLMEDFDVYKSDEDGVFESDFVTKLVRNFRSHEMILELPSRMFYENSLEACVAEDIKMLCGQVSWLKNRRCPILFHGVVGQHTKDSRSPSIYNKEEVALVKTYVGKFVRSGLVNYEDIGVICPYRKQVRMIKEELSGGLGGRILVGSTEQFQGQERKVMIISTVRSTETSDGKKSKTLGFLVNPRRFNVSVTRAQAMLVLIGDPYLLCQDEWWGDYLEFAIANEAYVGCSYEPKLKRQPPPPPPGSSRNQNRKGPTNGKTDHGSTPPRGIVSEE